MRAPAISISRLSGSAGLATTPLECLDRDRDLEFIARTNVVHSCGEHQVVDSDRKRRHRKSGGHADQAEPAAAVEKCVFAELRPFQSRHRMKGFARICSVFSNSDSLHGVYTIDDRRPSRWTAQT
jgi:hypothetical protein